MRNRRMLAAHVGVTLLVVVAAVSSCGRQPVTPSATTQPERHPDPRPGAYYFSISESPATVPGPGGPVAWVRLCMCMGSCPTAVQVPVDIERTTAGLTLRAAHGTLTGAFTFDGESVTGTVQGWARDAADGVTGLTVQSASASLSGLGSDRGMSGTLDGTSILLNGPNGSGACSSSRWSVFPR